MTSGEEPLPGIRGSIDADGGFRLYEMIEAISSFQWVHYFAIADWWDANVNVDPFHKNE